MNTKKKWQKRLLGAVLSLVLVAGLLPALPTLALAVTRDTSKSQVHVVVDNTVYTTAEGAEWEGVLVDTWVDINNDSTMMSAVVSALTEFGYTQEGADNGYISEINGLGAGVPDYMSGWMATLNDWFVSEGLQNFTVAEGELEANDEIHVFFSKDGGVDHSGDWNNNDTSVKSVSFSDASLSSASFSVGTLDKTFDSAVSEYTLTIPATTTKLMVTPTATNKNYQVRTSVGKTTYKRTESIPVSDGMVITVKCGDPEWPTMNKKVDAHTYTFKVVKEAATVEGTKGDVNNSGTINIVDAQIVYDLGNNVYGASYEKFPFPENWTLSTLASVANVNNDDTIDAADALAIQRYAHRGSFE